jgi:eukaryotic-like serine/threonine-protein kinase
VVYEWLCGIQPFQGTVSEVMRQHLFEAPIPPRKRVRKIHAGVEKVVLQALEKNPLRRFPSVLAFAEALDVAK